MERGLMGLVTDDLREWLAETKPLPESESAFEENPFRPGAARSAQAHLDAHLQGIWNRLTSRIHKWLDADWEPESDEGDHLTR